MAPFANRGGGSSVEPLISHNFQRHGQCQRSVGVIFSRCVLPHHAAGVLQNVAAAAAAHVQPIINCICNMAAFLGPGLRLGSESAVCFMAPILVRGVNGVCPSSSLCVGGLTNSRARVSTLTQAGRARRIPERIPEEHPTIGGLDMDSLHFLVAPLFALLIKLQNNGPHINKRGKALPWPGIR